MNYIVQEKLIYYKATVSYQGTYFYGWQSQKENITVQDCIEKTLYKIFKFHQRIIGASRTDSGVHAFGQVFSFYAPKEINQEKLLSVINNSLPDTIYINNIEIAEINFHPRFDAKKKVYQYLISTKKLSPAINFFILHYQKNFDIEILEKCCKIFIGTHDFKSFCATEKEKNTIRTIYNIDITLNNDIYIITIIGNGFLRYMIRRIIGAAIYTATKKSGIDNIENLLYGNNTTNNNIKTLPAKGLLLNNIIYNENIIEKIENPFLQNFNFY